MNNPDLGLLPGLKLQDSEPVFEQPWQAQAFAMAIALHENGVFTWTEWAEALSEQIEQDGSTNRSSEYYHQWLNALESLMDAKNIATGDAIDHRTEQWHRAAVQTPHGDPIVLIRGAETKVK